MTRVPLALVLPSVVLTACLDLRTKDNPDYCGNNDGDAYCGRTFGEDKPYCLADNDACIESTNMSVSELRPSGCVAIMPSAECHDACGRDGEDCVDPTDPTVTEGSSSGESTDTETDPTLDTDSATGTDTTGPAVCMGNDDCTNAALPFCVDDACVPCTATTEPDASCAELDPAAPLCIENACVQCTADDASACSGTTPLCDVESNTCVPCEFHEQCQDPDIGSPACNFVTGACFDPEAVSEVDAGTNGAIQDTLDGLANGAEHAIVLNGGGGLHTITVDGGKTIAIVSASSDPTVKQEVRGNSGAPTLTVTGAGTTVFLHRLQLTLNGDDVGIAVQTPAALFADSTQVSQNTGGGITLATATSAQLRNCMVQGNATSSTAIAATSANLNVVFSSLGRTANFGAPVLSCSGGTVEVRNSLIISETNTTGDEVNCAGASIETSRVDSTQTPNDWFGVGFASGDYHLTKAGQTEFADIAVWETGDPPFDFDGHDRPATDGAADFPGADTVP